MASVYSINKGINQPIEFKGLKAQYIWWLGGGLVVLLMLFTILYVMGVPPLICVGLILMLGTVLFMQVFRLSKKYGEHGMMKAMARRYVPKVIKVHSKMTFIRLATIG